jgi:hypothetical protein
MLRALESAESKLREYYAMTDAPELGDIYAHGTILAPQHKIQFFETEDWSDADYALQYTLSLKDRMKAYQTNDHLATQPTYMAATQVTDLDNLLDRASTTKVDKPDELTEYLNGGTFLFALV